MIVYKGVDADANEDVPVDAGTGKARVKNVVRGVVGNQDGVHCVAVDNQRRLKMALK